MEERIKKLDLIKNHRVGHKFFVKMGTGEGNKIYWVGSVDPSSRPGTTMLPTIKMGGS